MDSLLQDLRYSTRLLWNKRGYSIIVILTLALWKGNQKPFSAERAENRLGSLT